MVGYGPQPNEVCSLIEERAIPTIYGNYDWAIARDEEDRRCAYVTEHDREIGQLSVDWTLANTDARSKDFMRALPFDLRFELGGKRVRLVHGSPRKVNEYLFEDAGEDVRADRGRGRLRHRLGHTHKPWVREYGGVLFVNCGSVGKPKDGDPRGAFALLPPPATAVESTFPAWSTPRRGLPARCAGRDFRELADFNLLAARERYLELVERLPDRVRRELSDVQIRTRTIRLSFPDPDAAFWVGTSIARSGADRARQMRGAVAGRARPKRDVRTLARRDERPWTGPGSAA